MTRKPTLERLPPISIEAEQAVLGACILDSSVILLAGAIVQPSDFFRDAHRLIFDAMSRLAATAVPIDLVTLIDELERTETLNQVGGVAYIHSLATMVPTAIHVEHYARIVHRTAQQRRIIGVASRIAAKAYEGSSEPGEDIAEAQRLLHEIDDDADGAADRRPVRQTSFSAPELLACEFPAPRWVVPGLVPQGLTVLFGKPKVGKSWTALAMALATAAGGRALGSIQVEPGDVLYLALEDSGSRLQERIRKLIPDCPAPERLRVELEWPQLDQGGLIALNKWLTNTPDARLIVVDTYQRLKKARANGVNAYEADSETASAIQQLALRHRVGILLIHHSRKQDAADWLDTVNASQGLPAVADTSLQLTKEDRGRADAVLRGTGRDLEDDIDLALTFDSATAQWTIAGPSADYRISQQRARILAVLAEHEARGPKDIAALAQLDYDVTRQLLVRMHTLGEIQRIGHGLYLLPLNVHNGHNGHGDHQGELLSPNGNGAHA